MTRSTHIQLIAAISGKPPEGKSIVPAAACGAVGWQASANHNRLFHSALYTPSPLRACPGRRTGGGLGRGFFGETFIEQRSTTSYYTPYTFSAKERDTETGYSYFGARYYDADISVWLSVDPMADQRSWVSPYGYCQNSPVIRTDPTGALDWIPPTDGSGNWTAEPGDGYWKLSQQAGIPLEDAKNAVITANQNRGQARTSETMVYPSDVVNIGTPQNETSTTTTTPNYQMPYPASGACESVSVVGTLIDVFIREPIQDVLVYFGMSEDAAFWTSTGVTVAGSVVLARKISTMSSTASSRAFSSVDDMLAAGTKLPSVKGGGQVLVKGNIDDVFSSLTKGVKTNNLPNGRVQATLPDGTILTKYPASSGSASIQVNQGGKLTKVRFE